MAATPDDPAALLRWLTANQQDVLWLVALALGGAGWLAKRLRPSRSSAGRTRLRTGLIANLRSAAAAMQAASQPTTGRGASALAAAPGLGRRSAPAARPVAPAEPGLGSMPSLHLEDHAALRPRSPLLDAFRDPAGARTAVVLAEILAPPVGLR